MFISNHLQLIFIPTTLSSAQFSKDIIPKLVTSVIMSSRSFSTRSPKASKGKSKSTPKVSEEPNEPVALWEFDDEHDVPSIVCEVVYESVINEPNFSMSAYHNLSSDAENTTNKSDMVCLVSSAILERIGLKESSKGMRALSDQVNVLFKNLNLDSPAVLHQFVTLVTILNPEIIKTVESAVMAAMFVASRKTKIHHTTSRVQTALKGVVASESASSREVSFGAIGSNVKMAAEDVSDGINALLLDYSVEDFSDQEISPDESVSSAGDKNVMRPSESQLMKAIVKERNHKKAVESLKIKHKLFRDPIEPKGQLSRRGIGMTYEKYPTLTDAKGMNMRRASSIAEGEEKTGSPSVKEALDSLQSALVHQVSAKVTEEEAGEESSDGGI